MSEMNFKDLAANAAANACNATKLLAYITGHKVQIIRHQEKIRRLYAQLGKVYYKDHITEEEPDEAEYKPICDEITRSYRAISRLRDEIAQAKDEYRAVRDGIVEDEDDEEDVELLPLETPEA